MNLYPLPFPLSRWLRDNKPRSVLLLHNGTESEKDTTGLSDPILIRANSIVCR